MKEQHKQIDQDYNQNIVKIQKGFERDLTDLKTRKQNLRAVQKKYFKSSEKFLKEKEYYWGNYEKALSKTKLAEMFQKKKKNLSEYRDSFKTFKNVYDQKNLTFENRTLDFLELDTEKKKDFMLNWDLFTKKLIEDIELKKILTNKWKPEQLEVDCDEMFKSVLPPMNKSVMRESNLTK